MRVGLLLSFASRRNMQFANALVASRNFHLVSFVGVRMQSARNDVVYSKLFTTLIAWKSNLQRMVCTLPADTCLA